MTKRLMLSVVFVLLAALAVAPAGAAAPGDLDITFAGDGIVENNVGPLSHGGTALAIQPDGKILMAGDKQDAAVVARYNPNGSPDTTFGLSANGLITVKRNPTSEDEEATGMALLDTGRIIIATMDENSENSALFALDPFGAQINSFGVDGFVDTAYGDHYLRWMTLEAIPAGGVYALSTFFDDGGDNVYKAVLQQYRPNGTLNPNFGTAGSVVISFTGIWTFGNDITIMPDGDVMVVGRLGNSNGWLARYNADGTPETTFGGGDGIQENTFMVYGIDAQADGRFVVGGLASNSDAVMARYTATGAFDTTFGGGDGIILIDFVNSNIITRVAVHPDGSAYGVGSTGGAMGESGFIVSLTPTGIFNLDFAPLGVKFYSQGTYSALSDVVIDPQGRVVASGHGETGDDDHYTLIRYLHALVINPSMEVNDDAVNRVPDFWAIANGTSNDRIRCGAANFPANTGNCTVALVADAGVTTILSHRSRAAGTAGDDYSFSAALATRNFSAESQVRVIVSFHNGATVVGKETIEIPNLNSLTYQTVSASVTAPGDYTSIRIRVRVRGAAGRVLVDDVVLEETPSRAADGLVPMPPAP
ncbi:MAG: delta-60 repeat domain-containing protein [Anaerolineae bacterium]|nr:delta-60 repeat domain-containing protein [Anaerolineae bacterium]